MNVEFIDFLLIKMDPVIGFCGIDVPQLGYSPFTRQIFKRSCLQVK